MNVNVCDVLMSKQSYRSEFTQSIQPSTTMTTHSTGSPRLLRRHRGVKLPFGVTARLHPFDVTVIYRFMMMELDRRHARPLDRPRHSDHAGIDHGERAAVSQPREDCSEPTNTYTHTHTHTHTCIHPHLQWQ